MNNSIEKLLEQMSLVRPPDSLDRSVASALQQKKPPAPAVQLHGPSWPVSIGSAMTMGIGGLLLGLLLAGGIGTDASSGNRLAGDFEVADQLSQVQPANNTASQPVRLHDEGLFFLNGKRPVRKYRTVKWREVKIVDPETGEERQCKIPISQIIVTPSLGT